VTPARTATAGWKPAGWLAALVGLLALAVFLPAVRYDFVMLDDGGFVYENPHVISGLSLANIRWAFTAVHEQWWLPFLWISFMADATLFGPGPAGFHLTNLLLHAANAALLFWVLVRLTRSSGPAFFIAALFALHPLRVESVAWITERKDVLSGFFFFLALLAHIRAVERPSPARRATLFFLMLAGLLSKATALVLPPILLLLDFWPLRRAGLRFDRAAWTQWRPLVLEKTGLFVLAALFVFINLHTHVSATGQSAAASWLHRLALVAPDYLRYVGLFFWPARLCSHYPAHDTLARPLAFAAAAGLALLTGAFLRTSKKSPWQLVGWLWFLVALFPMVRGIRFDPMFSHADRYTYLAGIGLSILLVTSIAEWVRMRPVLRTAAAAAGALLLAACAWKTALQLPTWRNSLALYQQQAAVRPDNHIAHNNYGRALLEAGRAEEALPRFLRVMELRPDDSNLAAANYADALLQLGRDEEAAAWLRQALARRDPAPPNSTCFSDSPS
jgi:protein O-mannosyl-transferase